MLNPLPPDIVLDPLLKQWLQEDIGRGDHTTIGLGDVVRQSGHAVWVAKAPGIVAGLPVAQRLFHILDTQAHLTPLLNEGSPCEPGQAIATLQGSLETLLTGERVGLNLTMRLSGIATLTQQYVEKIADLPGQLVDTRKTTPGLRILEKYATRVGGAINHRMGLDDAVMVKDNHIAAAGGIEAAVTSLRRYLPYPLSIEVEVADLDMVDAALAAAVDIIMLDNMTIPVMEKALARIRAADQSIKVEASGNITLDTIRQVAQTGVDFISTSAPITRSPWLDISMRIR